MNTLLLTLEYPSRVSYYDDWRDAFAQSDVFKVTIRNIFHRSVRRRIAREVGQYDLIVILHSCTADALHYASELAGALQARRGRVVVFVGNELNLPWAPLGKKIAWLKQIEPNIVATQLLEEAGSWLYADVGAKVISLPHALNPRAFHCVRPSQDRPIDIGTRSYRYLAYLGDDDRNRIYDYFLRARFEPPLTLDFSSEHRFDRAGWAAFLNRCRATIATEAGSWYVEPNDATVLAIRQYATETSSGLVLSSESRLAALSRHLPYGIKALLRRMLRGKLLSHEAVVAEQLDFADIHRRFFNACAKAPVYTKCISSRHFDAVGCLTLQIMFPGRFNDILRADEHYVALAPDFSNIAEVLNTLRNASARRTIVERAHADVMSAHTYRHRLAALSAALS